MSYCASKGAVVNMTRAMAIDHGPADIRVNCVCPGSGNFSAASSGAALPPTHSAKLFDLIERYEQQVASGLIRIGSRRRRVSRHESRSPQGPRRS